MTLEERRGQFEHQLCRQFPEIAWKSSVASVNAKYSIRINKQWRICFRWEEGNAYDVEITDYH